MLFLCPESLLPVCHQEFRHFIEIITRVYLQQQLQEETIRCGGAGWECPVDGERC